MFPVSSVIDTRPLKQGQRGSGLMQIFSGAVVEVESSGQALSTVGLMEDMACDEHGFRFDYVLPLGANRLLIEATRFCPDNISNQVLENDLERAMYRVTGQKAIRIIRREQGAIAMGQDDTPIQPYPHWVYAGTRGGAVRASSGYAFRRIQAWAALCTQSLIEHGRPVSHPNEPRLRQWMDRLFLSVLRSHPERTPELFMRLASHTRPESLVKYLSDVAGFRDALAVIRSLPPALFLRQWSQNLFTPRVRVA
jgi:lycopene beta-cyclase